MLHHSAAAAEYRQHDASTTSLFAVTRFMLIIIIIIVFCNIFAAALKGRAKKKINWLPWSHTEQQINFEWNFKIVGDLFCCFFAYPTGFVISYSKVIG